MPTWRCPHCGTPQTETARCWVCRRSSTACDTCRHFRRSIAGTLGYCGLDRRRAPLRGDEIRACWEPRPVIGVRDAHRDPPGGPAQNGTTSVSAVAVASGGRDFVEVVGPGTTAGGPARQVDAGPQPGVGASGSGSADITMDDAAAGSISPHMATPSTEPRWDLWGDLEA